MKVKEYFYAIAACIGVFSDLIGIDPLVFWILTASFVLDFLTGMTKAWVTGSYKSKIGWVKTLAKVMGIGLIAVSALILKLVGINHSYFLLSSFMVLALHDLISSAGNIYTIRTGKELQEFDAISLLIQSLHSKLIKLAKKLMQDDK